LPSGTRKTGPAPRRSRIWERAQENASAFLVRS